MQMNIFYQIFTYFLDTNFLDRQVNFSQILLCRNTANIEFAAVYGSFVSDDIGPILIKLRSEIELCPS